MDPTQVQRTSDASGLPEHLLGFGPEMATAGRAAGAAGKVISAGYRRTFAISAKGFGDLFSQVDTDAEAAVLSELAQNGGKRRIISEESCPGDGLRPAGEFWLVDPLDSTSSYLFKVASDLPSVLVALCDEAGTKVGVAFFPLTGEWFYAERGRGAFKNGERLSVTGNTTQLADAWVDMNQFSDARLETDEFSKFRTKLRLPGGAKLITTFPAGSGLALRMLDGSKNLHAVIHDNRRYQSNCKTQVKQAPWDIAAPQLIIEEAGGVFLDFSGKRADPFGAAPIIAACSRELALELLALL